MSNNFKKTDYGIIPEDWNFVDLRSYLNLLTDYDANGSFSDMANNVNTKFGSGFAWYVRATDLEQESDLSEVRYADYSTYKFLKKSSLFGDEVLLAKRGEIGKVYYFNMKTKYATLGPNLYLLKLNKNINPKFLYYYFKSDAGQNALKSINASTSLGAIYKEDVKNLMIPSPNIKEQLKIAKILTNVDNMIEELKSTINKEKNIKIGMLGYSYSDNENTKKLSDMVFINRSLKSITAEKLKSINTTYGDTKLLSTGNFDGYTIFNKNKELAEDSEVITLPSGGSANIKYWKGKFINSGNLLLQSTDKNKYCLEYVYYYMAYIKDKIESFYRGTSIKHPELKPIMNIDIPFCDYKEQVLIASRLNKIDTNILMLENKLKKYEQLKKGLLEDLLTGKLRVKYE